MRRRELAGCPDGAGQNAVMAGLRGRRRRVPEPTDQIIRHRFKTEKLLRVISLLNVATMGISPIVTPDVELDICG